MDSNKAVPMPVRNYAEKVKAMLKKANSVQREPPRRRLDIHMPSCSAQTNLTRKVKWETRQKGPSRFSVANTNYFIQNLTPRSNHKSPRQSLAVYKTRGLAAKVPGKPIVVRPEARSKNNRSIHTGIPIPRTDRLKSPGRKSHVAPNRRASLNRRTTLASQNKRRAVQPSKVSEAKVLAADISGVMLLDDDAKSEIDAGACSNNFPLRIPLNHTQTSDNRTSFDDAFESLQKEYLAQLSEFHAGWMQRFSLLFKTRAESEARNAAEARDKAERSRRKSARLKQKDFINSLAKDTPCRITNTALKQMNFLESPWIDS